MAKPQLQLVAALLGSGFGGMLVATQSRLNGGFSQVLGNGYVVAAITFSGGLLVTMIALSFSREGRTGIGRVRRAIGEGRLPVWALLGGLGGAAFVLSQGLITPLTGVALFTVGIVAGQVMGGLAFDWLGLGPSGRIPATSTRLAGTVLAIVAVAVSVLAGGDAQALALILVPVIVGAGMAAQSMVNGLVRAAAESTVTATFGNFVVGAAALLIAAGVSVMIKGWPTAWPTEPWFYMGGVIGVAFVGIAAMLVRRAGVLLLSMSNVAGQLVAAMAFELGLPLTGGLTPALAVGTAIALVAVVIAALPDPRSGKASR